MSAFEKWAVLLTSGVTTLTGVLYWWMDTFLEPVSEWAIINHPLQPWVLKAHILAAPAMVFAIGLIFFGHIWKRYRSATRQARRSGVITLAVLGPMVLSGYLLQVSSGQILITILTWTHLVTGGIYGAALAGHQIAARRRRPGRRTPSVRPTSP